MERNLEWGKGLTIYEKTRRAIFEILSHGSMKKCCMFHEFWLRGFNTTGSALTKHLDKLCWNEKYVRELDLSDDAEYELTGKGRDYYHLNMKWKTEIFVSISNSSVPFSVKPPSWKYWPSDLYVTEFIITIRMRDYAIDELIRRIKKDVPEGAFFGPLDIVMSNNKEVEMPA